MENISPPPIESKPPLLPSWKSWYWLVMAALALQVIVYYYVTEVYK
jgi:hypothetical protein